MGPVLVNDMQTLLPLRSGQIEFFLLKDGQCCEKYAKTVFQFFTFFSFTKNFSFWDLSVMPNNQLTKGIQFKSVRALGAEPP